MPTPGRPEPAKNPGNFAENLENPGNTKMDEFWGLDPVRQAPFFLYMNAKPAENPGNSQKVPPKSRNYSPIFGLEKDPSFIFFPRRGLPRRVM